ncbi:site-specific DNA-methyltransferase [Gaoshiqia sp. Z1-71]|uniref:site-specific DNA-methyltransferase n=1 Tax=Gaoshiqia hydrogeniformans TaxID=3290090 RepID=UPI003BF85BFF
MPTLHWIGKEKVINHHMDVPFKVLEHSYGFDNGKQTNTETQSGNKIIHGDNLEALKALLPEYEGKIKCIYIDPPYNTGNESWVYNDNVNDPKIKKWLGQVVGKESEDLSRHDKWLCMMYPRLKLLHKLLANDGAIFISIDDNEQANLKLICDEIFGGGNFLATITWQKKYGPANDAKYLSETHEYVISFAKEKTLWKPKLVQRDEKQLKAFKNPDNDIRGLWRASDLSARTYSASTDYPIEGLSGDIFYPPKSRSWIFTKERFLELLQDNRITFGTNGKGRPMQKKFLSEVKQGITAQTWWDRDFAGDNKIARYELKEIFPENPFDTPKPSSLLKRIFEISTDYDSLILDSFAGSGTTAQAVLNLNKQDRGNRKFILIEMEDYAENITAERVKRVIKGYGDNKKVIEGTGGSFDFYELGRPLFNEDGNLNESVGIDKIRSYVWYTETKMTFVEPEKSDNKYFLGKKDETAYYFNYEPNEITTLNHEFLSTVKTKSEQYVIYADNCLLTKEFMSKHNIIFKKIPRDITRF